MVNLASIWAMVIICFLHRKHSISKLLIYRGIGKILKFLQSLILTVSQSFLKKGKSVLQHSYSYQESIHGILIFSIENYLCRRLICNIWQWKSSSWIHVIIYPQCMPVPVRQSDVLYDSFPNKSESILSCSRCISLCCLLRLAKKNQLFSAVTTLCSD